MIIKGTKIANTPDFSFGAQEAVSKGTASIGILTEKSYAKKKKPSQNDF